MQDRKVFLVLRAKRVMRVLREFLAQMVL